MYHNDIGQHINNIRPIFYFYLTIIFIDIFNALDNGLNYNMNNVLVDYFDLQINDRTLGRMLKIYLKNIFNVFEDHPNNIVNGEKLFRIEQYNDLDQIRLECVRIGGVTRLAIPINYQLAHDGGPTNFIDKYFAFGDIGLILIFRYLLILHDLADILDYHGYPPFNLFQLD